MEWKRFKLLNDLAGWLVFAISAVVYLLTIGPEASLWDCPEFILSAYHLEVGHPPGAPFYMLVYNLASQFASDPTHVAFMCNVMSALLSAATILLLFWTITHMVRRVLLPTFRPYDSQGVASNRSLSWTQGILILSSGIVGALAYTFSDTFWYSAVEAEVYAFSSFFTALVFWLIFMWEDRSDTEYSDRWIILIAYFLGLSIGVHLLNLLCIPAMALLFYFRKSKAPSIKGALLALLISAVLILMIMIGVVRGVMSLGTLFDVVAVNYLSLPVNSGFYLYLTLTAIALISSAYLLHKGVSYRLSVISFLISFVLVGIPILTKSFFVNLLIIAAVAIFLLSKKGRVNIKLLQTMQMCMVVIMIGFSSYGVILIRSVADTPMNQNAPNTAISLQKYLSRSQYGEIPHFSGITFASRPMPGVVDDSHKEWVLVEPQNSAEKPRYELNVIPRATYPASEKMLFTRMHSTDPAHIQGYNIWSNRDPRDMSMPTFGDNLRFLLSYQVNYMYWRYFGWNFIGRQNDLAGHGGIMNGNTITGFDFIDKVFVGPQDSLPDSLKNNKGHNVYYMLPLLLGLLGIAFQLLSSRKGVEAFWITFWLFFMTGLAIILYINQTPGQPRERDYAYAGSFYAFAIWIGFGVAGLWKLLCKLKLSEFPSVVAAGLIALIVPLQMASQNWDDHDRSGRRLASDFGYNYLESCEPNSVLFCFGDNDTFPLWYAQSLEGIRQDIKVCNLSYLQSDWYTSQMMRASYKAAPAPNRHISAPFYKKHLFAAIHPGGTVDFHQAMDALGKQVDRPTPLLTASTLRLPLDTTALKGRFDNLPVERLPYMDLSLENMSYVTRDAYMVLDMIGAANFERPVYYVSSMPTNTFTNLSEYLNWTGMAKRLNPWKVGHIDRGIDVDRTYDLVMNKFRYFNANDPKIYFDENIRQNIAYYYRLRLFGELATLLIERGEVQKAKQVMEKCHKTISPKAVPYTYTDVYVANAYYQTGMKEQGDEILKTLAGEAIQMHDWVSALDPVLQKKTMDDMVVYQAIRTLIDCKDVADRAGSNVLEPYQQKIMLLMTTYGIQG